jgi:hypothetical protein
MRFFSIRHRFKTGCEPNELPIQWVPGALTPEVKVPAVKVTTLIHVVPRLRMRGSVLPLP